MSTLTPPVSVGQTVYLIRRPADRPAWVDECTVGEVHVVYTDQGVVCRFKNYNFEATVADIGKTVFLSREDAERALQGGGLNEFCALPSPGGRY